MLEATAIRPFARSQMIEIRIGKAQMRGQCTDALKDVGQLRRPVCWRCITRFACLLKELIDKCRSVLTIIEGSIFRNTTRSFDDRRNQITNKFSHAQ